MRKKQQASLTSFFGESSKSKTKPKSRPSVKATMKASSSTTRPKSKEEDEECFKKQEEKDADTSATSTLMDTDDEEDSNIGNMTNERVDKKRAVIHSGKKRVVQTDSSEKNNNLATNGGKRTAKKAKLVIQDDDDDGEMQEEAETLANDANEKKSTTKSHREANGDEDCNEEDEDITLGSLKPTSKSASKSKSSSKPSINEERGRHHSSPKKGTKHAFAAFPATKQSKSSKVTSPMKSKSPSSSKESTSTVNTKDKKSQNTPIPYSILTETLSSIEAITGRLEIQSLLTKLFSQCIQSFPQDLITLVYLASNSVAPAYECVELGIGDAILIKAIGEANGSNANIIKQKYEADGDLGTVAMNAKGKQRTLGFGRKPQPLSAREVLEVYRKIANITGSQSQKTKVDMIKGLLVRATQKGNESKYIIRGLQGKLRIGLAQSTVLISLAHAILRSCTLNGFEGAQVDADDVDVTTKKKKNSNSDELSSDCRIVKNTKLAMDIRMEAAVNIVKKAYSEVSSFDKLVESMISMPLWKLNESCTLQPGFPVTPMLAKPTKSIQEVLKRLNGKRFTCEYKYDGERAQVHMHDDGLTKVCEKGLYVITADVLVHLEPNVFSLI